MPEDENSGSSSRPSPTGAHVRSRSPRATSAEHSTDGRPPTKRARKAINCEPCRASKLKCDRNRPSCSSCVLRGTTAHCYKDASSPQVSLPHRGADDVNKHIANVDPAQEIARLRASISQLESYISTHHGGNRTPLPLESTYQAMEFVDQDLPNYHINPHAILTNRGGAGIFIGPTSAAVHLVSSPEESESHSVSPILEDQDSYFLPMSHEYDRDLVNMLPPTEVVDQLIDHYFDYGCWIYPHINRPSFSLAWSRFKSGNNSDRITLATVCVILAVAVQYLPPNHPILEQLSQTSQALGYKYYDMARSALQRHSLMPRSYTLELVELHLIRCHFQILCKADSEEIWSIVGELASIAIGMGLHRDPGKWKLSKDVAERRRWCWWHLILVERWQAFIFGRPLFIASHHFDTQLPSYCDPAIDETGRFYLPNLALFRLAYILGDIVNDAVSLRPVAYSSILAHDLALTEWMESIPPELELDEYALARDLTSPIFSVRRLAVLSITIRTFYHNIRFTLHWPYSSVRGKLSLNAQSLEIAVTSAGKVIATVGQMGTEFLSTALVTLPGHLHWLPYHVFSSAVLFCFLLIEDPVQPGEGLFRSNIQKAVGILHASAEIPVAVQGYAVLDALEPLYSANFRLGTADEREQLKNQVLSTVRNLNFPYHEAPKELGSSSSSSESWSTGSAISPGAGSLVSSTASSMELFSNRRLPSNFTPVTPPTSFTSMNTDGISQLLPVPPLDKSSQQVENGAQQYPPNPIHQHRGSRPALERICRVWAWRVD